MCVLSIKLPIRKKSGNLFNYPRTINLIAHLSILDVVTLSNSFLRMNVKCNGQ